MACKHHNAAEIGKNQSMLMSSNRSKLCDCKIDLLRHANIHNQIKPTPHAFP